MLKSRRLHRRRRLLRVNRQMLCGSLEAFTARLHALGLSGRIQTAFIERVNLTLRRSLAPLARRSWSTAQLPAELTSSSNGGALTYVISSDRIEPCVCPWLSLARAAVDAAPQRFAARTPAMAVGLTQRPWSVLEVLSFPLPNH